MGSRAYVLIETSVGKTRDVAVAVSKIDGVKDVNGVTGPYDVIAIVEGADLTAVGNLVTSEIHPIAGIERTVTCLAVDFT